MRTTVELLDAVKRRHQLTSDYQLAKFLGISPSRLGNYRKGRSRPDDAMCIAVADALGIERGRVLAIVAAERAQSDQAKKEWLKLAGTAAVLVLGVAAVLGVSELVTVSASQSLYIMSNAAGSVTAALLALALTVLYSRHRQ